MSDTIDQDLPADLLEPVTRAKGLARLLSYALLDARDLGSGRTAGSVRAAIEHLKVEYGLNEHEILQPPA